MSEYYCSHQPPCCPKVESLESKLRAADELAKAAKEMHDLLPACQLDCKFRKALAAWEKECA